MTVSDEAAAQAVAFKDEGNKAFAKKDWHEAIEKYTKAIELDPTKPAYYTNRAAAYIKSESHGYAAADATKAIELDPNFIKAYYRRAMANMGILKHSEALKDFRTVVKKVPNDKDARTKLEECQKFVRRLNFEKAIEMGEPASAAEGLNLDDIAVDDSYDGMRLEKEMTPEFVLDMIERFKNGKKLHRKYAYQIVLEATKIFREEPTMPEVEIPKGATMTVCGDTHGQYFDLLNLFNLAGPPSPTHFYLFNGDFVDRGSWSTEIAFLLYAYKWLYPKSFFINRGNHETDDMNKVYGFEGECKAKYNDRTFKLFSESFSALPLATLIGKQYLVLHGGLFSDDKTSLDDIRKFNRHRQRQPGSSGLMMEMLWTDPQPQPGRGPSKRGIGLQFGPDITARFCDNNGLKAIIRSHEVRQEGFEAEHNGRCITVFSAPNYVDQTGNKGAFINFDDEYNLEHKTFEAVPHPDIKPMAYAQSNMMQMM